MSTARAVLLAAFGALAQAVVAPYLTFGPVAPALAVLCVVVAAAGLKETVALPVGFFGGTLVDALGSGLFGVGALSGVLAAALSSWSGLADAGRTGPANGANGVSEVNEVRGLSGLRRLKLAGVVGAAVAAHDLVSVAALGLSGDSWPPMAEFVPVGLLPDVALNALLAYAVGGLVLRILLVRDKGWT